MVTARRRAAAPGPAGPATALWHEAWRRFRRHRLALTGAVILLVMVTAVLAGPLVYRVPIDAIDFKAKLKGPSWAHPLGTDDLGQDLLARMLYGGRISLAVGVAAMLIAITLGTLVGAVAGHVGGAVDNAPHAGDRSLPVAARSSSAAARRLPLPRHPEEGTRARRPVSSC